MKKKKQKTAAEPPAETPPAPRKNRTVKVDDKLHHHIRVLSVKERVPMQHFFAKVIKAGLKSLGLEEFDDSKAGA